MGFMRTFRSAGDFVAEWERRFGSLSREQLDRLRDTNYGLFTAWTQLGGRYPGSVGDFIEVFRVWAFPATDALEYLLAFRTVFAMTLGDPSPHPAFDEWARVGGAPAPFYPPGHWFDEWYDGLASGIYSPGTKNGQPAGLGEVIIGKDALQLVEQQFQRDAVLVGPAEIAEADDANDADPGPHVVDWKPTSSTIDVKVLGRKIDAGRMFDYDVDEVEPDTLGPSGAMTRVFKEAKPIDEGRPYVVVVVSTAHFAGELTTFATLEEATAYARTARRD
jgi:hypothetical protein